MTAFSRDEPYRDWIIAMLLSVAIAAGLNAPASAASPFITTTSDLIPGPPPGSWTIDADYTGPMTVKDIYGSSTAPAPGFSGAYSKSWYQPEVEVDDVVMDYNSVFGALYALSTFKVDAQNDTGASSFRSLSGFGYGAFEVTYPADTSSYRWDEIYFAVGDHVAWVSLGAAGAIARDVLLDQSSRQLAKLPAATAEVSSIRTGILATALGVALAISIAVAILLLVLLPQRRAPAGGVGLYAAPYGMATVAPTGAAELSDDRRHWWDGQAWQDTAVLIPPWAQISPDGTRWWDGAGWRPMPPTGGARS
jgi:hypothetical protein